MIKPTPLQALRDLVDVFNVNDEERLTPARIVELSKQYHRPADGLPLGLNDLRQAVLASAIRVLDGVDPFSPPRWVDAPSWAQWLAQDYDCRWFWYAAEPVALMEGVWTPQFPGANSLAKAPNERAANSAWRNTLQRRPEAA